VLQGGSLLETVVQPKVQFVTGGRQDDLLKQGWMTEQAMNGSVAVSNARKCATQAPA
jgi:hypothetical protein